MPIFSYTSTTTSNRFYTGSNVSYFPLSYLSPSPSSLYIPSVVGTERQKSSLTPSYLKGNTANLKKTFSDAYLGSKTRTVLLSDSLSTKNTKTDSTTENTSGKKSPFSSYYNSRNILRKATCSKDGENSKRFNPLEKSAAKTFQRSKNCPGESKNLFGRKEGEEERRLSPKIEEESTSLTIQVPEVLRLPKNSPKRWSPISNLEQRKKFESTAVESTFKTNKEEAILKKEIKSFYKEESEAIKTETLKGNKESKVDNLGHHSTINEKKSEGLAESSRGNDLTRIFTTPTEIAGIATVKGGGETKSDPKENGNKNAGENVTRGSHKEHKEKLRELVRKASVKISNFSKSFKSSKRKSNKEKNKSKNTDYENDNEFAIAPLNVGCKNCNLDKTILNQTTHLQLDNLDLIDKGKLESEKNLNTSVKKESKENSLVKRKNFQKNLEWGADSRSSLDSDAEKGQILREQIRGESKLENTTIEINSFNNNSNLKISFKNKLEKVVSTFNVEKDINNLSNKDKTLLSLPTSSDTILMKSSYSDISPKSVLEKHNLIPTENLRSDLVFNRPSSSKSLINEEKLEVQKCKVLGEEKPTELVVEKNIEKEMKEGIYNLKNQTEIVNKNKEFQNKTNNLDLFLKTGCARHVHNKLCDNNSSTLDIPLLINVNIPENARANSEIFLMRSSSNKDKILQSNPMATPYVNVAHQEQNLKNGATTLLPSAVSKSNNVKPIVATNLPDFNQISNNSVDNSLLSSCSGDANDSGSVKALQTPTPSKPTKLNVSQLSETPNTLEEPKIQPPNHPSDLNQPSMPNKRTVPNPPFPGKLPGNAVPKQWRKQQTPAPAPENINPLEELKLARNVLRRPAKPKEEKEVEKEVEEKPKIKRIWKKPEQKPAPQEKAKIEEVKNEVKAITDKVGEEEKSTEDRCSDSAYWSSPSSPQPNQAVEKQTMNREGKEKVVEKKEINEETCEVCGTNCHKKCEKQIPNLCGVNQKLLAEALSSVKKGGDSRDISRNSTVGSPDGASSTATATTTDDEEDSTDTTDSEFSGPAEIRAPIQTPPKFRKYILDDFQFIKVLGKGSFGKVMLAQQKGAENYFAVKCLKKDVVLEDNDVECTLIERRVLTMGTRHPYLCHLFCSFQTPAHLFFVMEYLTGGDLMFHIQHVGRFDEYRSCFYASEIISGLKFLHSKGIIYRDLKLDNILLDYEGHIRIADFGMCKMQIYLDRYADTFCGTPDYMAPEVIKGSHYNQCVDWWSYGVLLYEMLVGKSPFKGCDEDHLFWLICNEEPFYPRFLSKDATSLLKQLLDKDCTKRLGIPYSPYGEIKAHPFFKYIDWNKIERKEMETPYKPRLRHILDVQYFDPLFTRRNAVLTPLDSSILETMDQAPFLNFSYTNPNITD